MTPPLSVILRGTGSCLPPRVVANDEFKATIDTSDEWIRTRTGISERRFAGAGESSASLALTASRRALEAARLEPGDIDLIVCATVTPDLMSPCNANLIQAGLGCRPVPSFDVLAACTGFLYALAVADQFIRGGMARNVLVAGAEALSRSIDMTDRNSCILFGDGAGAAVLSAGPPGRAGLRSIRLFSDATRPEVIQVPSMVTPTYPGKPPVTHLRLQGREVFKLAVKGMSELVRKAMAEAEAEGRPIDLLVPHQVNQRIIDAILEGTNFPADRVHVNLDRYGNTGGASVPIALDEAIRSGRAQQGDTILFIAFGAGLTWGSTLLTL